jgi:PAS domain-containing protein
MKVTVRNFILALASRPLSWVATMRNALAESSTVLIAVDQAAGAIMIADSLGRITYANGALARLAGRPQLRPCVRNLYHDDAPRLGYVPADGGACSRPGARLVPGLERHGPPLSPRHRARRHNRTGPLRWPPDSRALARGLGSAPVGQA